MIQRFVNRYVPAGRSEERQRARQLVLASLGSVPLWLGFSVWYLLAYRSAAGVALTLIPGLVACGVPWLVRRTGSIGLTGNLTAAVSFAAFTGLAVLRGGFPIHILAWNLVLPMYATLMVRSPLNVALWAIACIGEIVLFFALELSGHAPAGALPVAPRTELVAAVISLTALAGYLIYLARPIASSQDQLGAERDDLEQRLQQRQRLDSLSDLAGGIAHDFANVLTGMRGSVELLRHRATFDATARADLETLAACVERGAGLTRRLVAFARRDEARPQPVDVNESLGETKALLRRLLSADITVATALAPALWTVRIDPVQLDRVLLNLAINARDAMPRGGELMLRTANVELDRRACRDFEHLQAGRYVRIDVEDSGCGMPPEILEHIFEPFFTTKGGGAGAGLGLASCFGVVRQAAGEIKVTSEVGKGSRFSIFLPAMRCEGERAAKRESSKPVLVFEDEESIRDAALVTDDPN